MKYSTSREKLSQIHEELDRELELASAIPRSSAGSRKDREELRYNSNLEEGRKANVFKPTTFDHSIKDTDIRTKKHEINELERKLMDLENKLNNCGNQSDESDEEIDKVKPSVPSKAGLTFKERAESQANEDTARFLVSEGIKERAKYNYSYPSLEDQQEEQDSEDYEEMQRAIEKKKQEAREQNGKRTVNTIIGLGNKVANEPRRDRTTDRKISTQTETALKPKYSNEKKSVGNKSRLSQQGKGSIRNSTTSKKSVEKNQPTLNRANSKRSVKSINSSRSKNNSKQKDRSFDRFSQKGDDLLHSDQMQLAKDLKKMSNLEKELAHYKRLAKKYQQQLEDYRIMQIQFKQMKKNFAKSELIRTQQKKVIETLKNKMGK